jgi:hypothetical protein
MTYLPDINAPRGLLLWQSIVVVPVISLKTVRKHQTQGKKEVSKAVGTLRTIRNVPPKPVRKAVRTVTAVAVNLTSPKLYTF